MTGVPWVSSAHIITVISYEALESYPYIGLDILNQMPEMYTAVSIRKSAGYQNFTFILHISFIVFAALIQRC